MSGMMLDKSLDSIIADKKKGGKKRPARRSGTGAHAAKAKLLGKGGLPAAAATKRRASAPGAADTTSASSATMAVKIIISNLPTDVNEAQVKDLFASTVGPVRTCNLQYNAGGKSSGTATVVFIKQGDAQKAFDQYNNRLIDGKRPMKIEIVYDPTKQPLVNRVAAPKPAAATSSTVAAAGSGGGGPRRGGARRGRGGRRGGGSGVSRPKKTAEDLDAEMADYTKEGNATA